MKNTKGFTVIEGLLILVIVGIVGGTGWYVFSAKGKTNNIYNNSSIGNSVAKKAQTIKTKSYTNKTRTYSVKYPAAWSVKEDSPTTGWMHTMLEQKTIVFNSGTKYGDVDILAFRTGDTRGLLTDAVGQASPTKQLAINGYPALYLRLAKNYSDGGNSIEDYYFITHSGVTLDIGIIEKVPAYDNTKFMSGFNTIVQSVKFYN